MANTLTTNPIFIDTAAGSTITNQRIMQIQWLDDASDVADGDDLSFTVNGVTIIMKANIGSDVGQILPVVFEVGPFSRPFIVSSLVVNTIDHGVFLVWLV